MTFLSAGAATSSSNRYRRIQGLLSQRPPRRRAIVIAFLEPGVRYRREHQINNRDLFVAQMIERLIDVEYRQTCREEFAEACVIYDAHVHPRHR